MLPRPISDIQQTQRLKVWLTDMFSNSSTLLRGSNFLAKLLLAPVKNENLQVILFILNFDELNEQYSNNSYVFSKHNRILQQIGMPFITSIFARADTSPAVKSDYQIGRKKSVDPFKIISKKKGESGEFMALDKKTSSSCFN